MAVVKDGGYVEALHDENKGERRPSDEYAHYLLNTLVLGVL